MENFVIQYGYPALFLLSFLAATVLPLGSEWLLAVMLLNGADPAATVAVATVGNVLGACTTWMIGLYGGDFLTRKLLRIDEGSLKRGERFFARYGSWSLLLSWVPVIGDPLCLVAGVLRVNAVRFVVLVFIGKLARYCAVSAMMSQV